MKTIKGYVVTCKGKDFIIQAGFNGISNFGYVKNGIIKAETSMGLSIKSIKDYILTICY